MGKFKKFFLKKTLPFAVAMSTVFTGIPAGNLLGPGTVEAAVEAASASESQTTKLADNIQDGAILHCWCWSFNTIKENMADIAAAGFTTVQTSPANACNDTHPTMKLMGNDTTNGTDGCWWWHYQPTDWTIGNYQLGTRDDFKAMCEEADKYGIQVIVDVIPNHTTPELDEVSDNLYNAVGGKDNLFHGNGFNSITQWGDRYECTTGMMGGLPDVDTENPDFQVYFLNYLNDLIECGADGFRYDTAKHIGVPSDPVDSKSASKGETTNFWPVVTGEQSVNGVSLSDSDRIFIYGEVLQGDNVPESEYAEYMRMTASSFGGTLRSAVKNKNFNVNTISNLQHSTPSRLVTWVESHDTYCNEGESVGLTDTQIRLAWAVIAARKDGTPLFYSRPDGSDGWNNRWGNNVIGAKGNDEFQSAEVKAVNFFRNAMAGKSEYLRNPNGNSQILQIDRGTEGTCIINLGDATTLNNVPTSMADGTYTDQVSGRSFTVSGGKLSGQLDGAKVAVIYNPDGEPDTDPDLPDQIDGSYDVYFMKPSGWGSSMYCYAYESETSSNAEWPGLAMEDLGDGVYAYNLPEGWTAANIIFTDGSSQIPGAQQAGVEWTEGTSMLYVNGAWKEVEEKEDPGEELSITSSLKDGSSFEEESAVITLTLKNAESGTYCVDDGPVKEFTDSADVVIGKGKIADTDITVKVTASDGTEEIEKVFTYHKAFHAKTNGGSVSYTSENASGETTGSDTSGETSSAALGGHYATNPNGQMGANKTITSAADFDASTLIAQGVANDDPRIFRGSHEGPVYDTYALYGAWDDENIYIGWQFTNVTDVVDPAQGYPISDNGKPWNGDIPQMLAFNLGTGEAGSGKLEDGGYVWGLTADFETPIDALLCFSSKPGVGQPALFTAADGAFSYDTCIGFTEGGISYTYEDGLFGDGTVVGVNGNGYAGYVPSMLLDDSSDWVDFTELGHDTAQDTFYTMTIPMDTLGVTKEQIETYGIGVMHLTTFGQSTTGSIPMDMSMLDCATEPYSEDDSTSAEKEDVDVITVPLARLGAQNSDPGTGLKRGTMTVNFGADRSAPQADTTDLLLKAEAKGGVGAYTYQFLVNGKEVQNSEADTYNWNTTGGTNTISVVVTDSEGHQVTVEKEYDIEGDCILPEELEVTSFTAELESPQKQGTTVRLDAEAKGGTGELQYRFYRVLNGKTTVFRDYQKWDTAYCNPPAGDYTVYVDVKDAAGNVATASMNFSWEEAEKELSIKNITTSLTSPQKKGTTVQLFVEAEGGEGELQYRFYREKEDTITIFRDYQKWDNAYCNPGVGAYTIYVDVKDASGKVVTGSIQYTWESLGEPVKITSFTADLESPQKQGTTVRLAVEADGGTGNFQYRFYRKGNGKVTVFRDYASSNVAYSDPPEAGTYIIYVDVKDSEGEISTRQMVYTWE